MTSLSKPPNHAGGHNIRARNHQLCNNQPRVSSVTSTRQGGDTTRILSHHHLILIERERVRGRGRRGLLITDTVSTFKPSWSDKRVEMSVKSQALDSVCLAVTRASCAYQRYQCRALLPYQTLYLTLRTPSHHHATSCLRKIPLLSSKLKHLAGVSGSVGVLGTISTYL